VKCRCFRSIGAERGCFFSNPHNTPPSPPLPAIHGSIAPVQNAQGPQRAAGGALKYYAHDQFYFEYNAWIKIRAVREEKIYTPV
jgi:hypothetical protein